MPEVRKRVIKSEMRVASQSSYWDVLSSCLAALHVQRSLGMNGNQALSFCEAGLECEAFSPSSDTIIISEIFPLLGLLYPRSVDVTGAQVRPLGGV